MRHTRSPRRRAALPSRERSRGPAVCPWWQSGAKEQGVQCLYHVNMTLRKAIEVILRQVQRYEIESPCHRTMVIHLVKVFSSGEVLIPEELEHNDRVRRIGTESVHEGETSGLAVIFPRQLQRK